MKITEILSELTIGKTGASVSTIDRSSSFVKKGMKIAGERTKKIQSAETDTDRFNFLYKETDGFTSKKSIQLELMFKGSRMSLVDYDQSTGDIIVSDQKTHSSKDIIQYKFNVSDIKYQGREKSISSPQIKYKFEFNTEPLDTIKKDNEKASSYKKGRPKKHGNFNSDLLSKSNNPFGL